MRNPCLPIIYFRGFEGVTYLAFAYSGGKPVTKRVQTDQIKSCMFMTRSLFNITRYIVIAWESDPTLFFS